MFKYLMGGAALAVAAPAMATVYPYDFAFSNGNTTIATSANTTIGNVISMDSAAASNGSKIAVTASAWNANLNSSGKYVISKAVLGRYVGGLGATSSTTDELYFQANDEGDFGTHQIDNQGNDPNSRSIDFVRLDFSKAVTLGSFVRYAYGSANAGITGSTIDDDYSYGSGPQALEAAPFASLSTLFQYSGGNNGACVHANNAPCIDTANLKTIQEATAATASTTWYISASIIGGSNANGLIYGNDNEVDAFKVYSLRAYADSAVPEPASWAMMVGGFGLLGAALRRKRTSAASFV